MHTHPAPHHHIVFPLPLLTSRPPLTQPLAQSSLPLSSSVSADLAETSDAATDAAVTVRARRQSLSAFYFYGLLRHKLEVIQRLANPVTGAPSLSPECVAFLEQLRLLSPGLQLLVLGLRPSLANYAPGFMVCYPLPRSLSFSHSRLFITQNCLKQGFFLSSFRSVLPSKCNFKGSNCVI